MQSRQLKLELEITETNIHEDIEFEHKGKYYAISRAALLAVLINNFPDTPVFHKSNFSPYKLEFSEGTLGPKSPKIPFSLILKNDIIFRPSVGSQQLRSELIFIPVIIKDKRIIKTHLAYVPFETQDDKPRYNVISSKLNIKNKKTADLGKGGFGAVYSVLATHDHTRTPLLKTHKNRAVKVQTEDLDISKEFYLQQLSGQIKAKGKVVYNKTNYITLEKGFSENLYTVIYKYRLTIRDKFELSINCLKALQEVHNRGIVHKDIKPENILVDLTTLKVQIIDYGISKKIISKESEQSGTISYVAPEVLTEVDPVVDERADIFSAGIVLSMIWGSRLRVKESHSLEYIKSMFNQKQIISLDDLFPDLSDIEKEKMAGVRELIKNLIVLDPNLRTYLNLAIAQLQKMELEYYIFQGTHNENDAQGILNAKQAAELLQERLAVINYPDEYIIEKLEAYIAQLTESKKPGTDTILAKTKTIQSELNRIAQKYQEAVELELEISPQLQTQLEEKILEAKEQIIRLEIELNLPETRPSRMCLEINKTVLDLDNKGIVISAFTDTLGLKCLKSCYTKDQLIETVKEITDQANINLQSLETAIKRLDELGSLSHSNSKDYIETQNMIFTIDNKFNKPKMDLDKYADLNDKFSEKIAGFSTLLDSLEAKIIEEKRTVNTNPVLIQDSSSMGLENNIDIIGSIQREISGDVNLSTSTDANIQINSEIIACSYEIAADVIKGLLHLEEIVNNELYLYKKYNGKKSPPQALTHLSEKIDNELNYYHEVKITNVEELDIFNRRVKNSKHNVIKYTSDFESQLVKLSRTNLVAHKKEMEEILLNKISNAKTISDILDSYGKLKDNRDFLRIERGVFLKLFQNKGTTATWGRVIHQLQKKALEILNQQPKRLTELQDKFFKEIFSEKSKRISFGNSFRNEYTTKFRKR